MTKKYSPDPLADVEVITGKSYKDPENNRLSKNLGLEELIRNRGGE